MSLVNQTSIAFASSLSLDKIVRVFTGSYAAADLTTRVGAFATAYVYRFPHSLTRPVACELIYSTDSGTTWQDGGTSKLAFSDSTYIYIFHDYVTTDTPVLYKVYCSWIDDYDATNPLVTTISYTDVPTQFDSRLNYQKIADQNVLSFTGATVSTQVVTHTLGYTPNCKVFFEAFTGEAWPLNAGGASNFFNYTDTQDECQLSIYTDRIEVTMSKASSTTKRAWYRIYYDAT